DHSVALFLSASELLAVNRPGQEIVSEMVPVTGMPAARLGTKEQPVLQTMGDDTRIDWGYLYLAAPQVRTIRLGTRDDRSRAFEFRTSDALMLPSAPSDTERVIAMDFYLGNLGAAPV